MTKEEMVEYLVKKSVDVGGADRLARWVSDLTGAYCSYSTAYAWTKKRKVISEVWKRLIEIGLEGGAKKD